MQNVSMATDHALVEDAETIKRRLLLAELRAMLPSSPEWEAWLKRSGELPPDFDSLPSCAALPDLLTDSDSNPIRTGDAWAKQRLSLLALLHHWLLGQVPSAPDNLTATVLQTKREPHGSSQQVELRFGKTGQARLRLELLFPHTPGQHPVFLTQHNHRDWALIAARRGYVGAVFSGADSQDDTDTFQSDYSEYDWSLLTRRAWAASRCVDYLQQVPEANARQIALTGHSRNGKSALIASALDPRIACVISSSAGSGGCLPFRCFSEPQFGEGIEHITRSFPDWLHPRLRFFAGREHKLPLDMHALVALSAPRPCLLATALNDPVESVWATEQTYQSVHRVYHLLNADRRFRILWRQGAHETDAALIERYLDWCDTQFGRQSAVFPERMYFAGNADLWHQANTAREKAMATRPAQSLDELLLLNGAPLDSRASWEVRREMVQSAVRGMLGEEPPAIATDFRGDDKENAAVATLLGRAAVPPDLERVSVPFGEHLHADVYLPAGVCEAGRKLPGVLWLHPFSVSNGYHAVYRRGEPFPQTLARAGYAVFCFDQIGFGQRIEEGEHFAARHPHWSLLGKMVRDVRAALDRMQSLAFLAESPLYGVGYGMGAFVGLHAGALDERLHGFAAVCPPLPYRDGIEMSQSLLLPLLNGAAQHPDRLPYDIPLLYGCFAPRPLLLVTPQYDRVAPLPLATEAVAVARPLYTLLSAEANLVQSVPPDYNVFSSVVQKPVLDWLRTQQAVC